MAIYDYYCKKCGKNYEKWLKIHESEYVKCDICGELLVKEIASKMNFKLIYNPEKHRSSWGNEGYSNTQRHRAKDGK